MPAASRSVTGMSMSERGSLVWVTGTDTGVGKTFVSEGLVRWLRANGTDAIAIKPIETGWIEASSDARRLAIASDRPVARTIWQHFQLPAAPAVAATEEGRVIDPKALIQWIHGSRQDADLCFVEGAGGWMVPFGRSWLFGDLVARLPAPVLIVGRAGLGTINHTLMTAKCVVETNPIAAVVLSRPPDVPLQVARVNQTQIQQRVKQPVLLFPDDLHQIGALFHVKH